MIDSLDAPPWYSPKTDFFNADYAIEYPSANTVEADREATFALEVAMIKSAASILDIGCGTGRHAIALAKRGHHVVALDINQSLLQLGKGEAQQLGLNVDWVCSDMLQPLPAGPFDLVVMMFTSFGLLQDRDSHTALLTKIRSVLGRNGHLFLDIPNRDWIVRNFAARSWFERSDGVMVLDQRAFDSVSGAIDQIRVRIRPDGARQSLKARIFLYSPSELASSLRVAGFRINHVYGNFTSSALTLEHVRCCVIASQIG